MIELWHLIFLMVGIFLMAIRCLELPASVSAVQICLIVIAYNYLSVRIYNLSNEHILFEELSSFISYLFFHNGRMILTFVFLVFYADWYQKDICCVYFLWDAAIQIKREHWLYWLWPGTFAIFLKTDAVLNRKRTLHFPSNWTRLCVCLTWIPVVCSWRKVQPCSGQN